MMNSVSFMGSVTKAPQVQGKSIPTEEKAEIQKFADDHDVDVHILDKQTYADGKGKYTTAVYKEYGAPYIKTFNMRFPECNCAYHKPEKLGYDQMPDMNSLKEIDEESLYWD